MSTLQGVQFPIDQAIFAAVLGCLPDGWNMARLLAAQELRPPAISDRHKADRFQPRVTMKPQDLSPDSQAKLEELVRAIEFALNAQKNCPHVTAKCITWREDEMSFNGGSLVAPRKPQFDYDDATIRPLLKDILAADFNTLRGILIHADRPGYESQWQVKCKLVSRDEHRILTQARKPIDVEVERELRKFAPDQGLKEVSFRNDSKHGSRVLRQTKAVQWETLEPTPALLNLLKKAEQLYEAAGLRLVTCDWSVRPAAFEFTEYYE